MSLGKSSIKRASAASKKKVTENNVEVVVEATVENVMEAAEATVENTVEAAEKKEVEKTVKKAPRKRTSKKTVSEKKDETEEIQVKFIPEEIQEDRKNRPVRLTEEMPTYLL